MADSTVKSLATTAGKGVTFLSDSTIMIATDETLDMSESGMAFMMTLEKRMAMIKMVRY